jgi:hypothetical protein
MPDHRHPADDDRSTQPDYTRLRRVIIEGRQQKTLDHVRSSAGYATTSARTRTARRRSA